MPNATNTFNRIWLGKCPRCHKGNIFKYPITKVSRFAAMHNECPVCKASFNPEPGFYFGALFVSYAFTVAIMVAVWLALYVLVNPSDWIYGVALVTGAVLFSPVSFRLSRVLWLYWFGGHKHNS
ncbi:MAG: DUF983 domain-containing protein [Cyclobacteriaceae bacterium]|nr:MAG: DUF983 domain-containing protein [Cyclobacteriaceae bacterium]